MSAFILTVSVESKAGSLTHQQRLNETVGLRVGLAVEDDMRQRPPRQLHISAEILVSIYSHLFRGHASMEIRYKDPLKVDPDEHNVLIYQKHGTATFRMPQDVSI